MSVVLCLALLLAADEPDVETDPREDLKTAIPHGIELLEEEKFREFLEKYVHPDDLQRITSQLPIDDFAKAFGEQKAERLLKILKEIQDDEPELNADETIAEFKLDEEVQGKASIRFKKSGKLWYIVN